MKQKSDYKILITGFHKRRQIDKINCYNKIKKRIFKRNYSKLKQKMRR